MQEKTVYLPPVEAAFPAASNTVAVQLPDWSILVTGPSVARHAPSVKVMTAEPVFAPVQVSTPRTMPTSSVANTPTGADVGPQGATVKLPGPVLSVITGGTVSGGGGGCVVVVVVVGGG